ncbi:MAG: Flp pilus assembly complex ATPase component TadA [Puniceicoccales bacterium]|jgi:type II secretory ATPase GspE/PulE/Tfp pilus assembly ATPase PilB-like protein|nr:Flp pilus assembly complex ATPase component TadA [Puniceicoccales bacterium]
MNALSQEGLHHPLRPSAEALAKVPASQAKRHRILPLRIIQDSLLVATLQEGPNEYLSFLAQNLGLKVIPLPTPLPFLEAAIKHYYGPTASETEPHSSLNSNTPTALLVEGFLREAIEKQCSDIHLEPFRDILTVRYRKDGFLKTVHRIDRDWYLSLITYLKLKAQLNIAEKYRPQDGSFEHPPFNVRISCLPSLHGETIVLRLLPPVSDIPSLTQLDLHRQTGILENLQRVNGCVCLSGPIGSGKTTTLYALLLHLATLNKRILTIEDPVEYRLPNVGQIHWPSSEPVENILRFLLRQNVDVLVVGEIRHRDRLNLALNAALTGHLVLTTLHATHAHQAVDRLIYMGASTHLLESTLRYVVGQRLVRRLCPNCAQEDPEPYLYNGYRFPIKREKGCESCLFTGFSGRIGVYECFELPSSSWNVGQKALKERLRPTGPFFSQNLTCLLREGIVSLSEAKRFTLWPTK